MFILFHNLILLDSQLTALVKTSAMRLLLFLALAQCTVHSAMLTSRLRFCPPFCPLTTCIIMPRFVRRFCTRKRCSIVPPTIVPRNYPFHMVLSSATKNRTTCLRTWNEYAFVSLSSSDSNNLVEPSSTEQIMFWLRGRFLQSLPAVSNFCTRGGVAFLLTVPPVGWVGGYVGGRGARGD